MNCTLSNPPVTVGVSKEHGTYTILPISKHLQASLRHLRVIYDGCRSLLSSLYRQARLNSGRQGDCQSPILAAFVPELRSLGIRVGAVCLLTPCFLSLQPLRVNSQPGPQKRCLFVCRHGERMDVVFGKYWLSQCFDAKGE